MTPEAIHRLRDRLGETQEIFAKRFGVSQITVGYWESGRSKPNARRMTLLEEVGATAKQSWRALPFRPIQYLGSKQRLAQTIVEVLAEVAPGGGRVGDLFAGSCVVGGVIGVSRPVTAVDVQAYSEVLARAVLWGRPEHLIPLGDAFLAKVVELAEEAGRLVAPLLAYERRALDAAARYDVDQLVSLMEYGSLAVHRQRPAQDCPDPLTRALSSASRALNASRFSEADLTATRYFAGPYFSYAQTLVLDAMAIAAKDLSMVSRRMVDAIILSVASEIVNTVGKQFAQPMRVVKAEGRTQPLLLQRALHDRKLRVDLRFTRWLARWEARLSCEGGLHAVERGDVLDFVASDRDCVAYYADPPYTIDHYSRFYHVLETLVRRDAPGLDEMRKGGNPVVMRGVYRTGRFQSPFCIPSSAPSAFESLFAATARRDAPLVLSYSPFDRDENHRSRLLNLDDLVAMARARYRKVEVVEISEHSHRKLNTRGVNVGIRADAERLLVCEA